MCGEIFRVFLSRVTKLTMTVIVAMNCHGDDDSDDDCDGSLMMTAVNSINLYGTLVLAENLTPFVSNLSTQLTTRPKQNMMKT